MGLFGGGFGIDDIVKLAPTLISWGTQAPSIPQNLADIWNAGSGAGNAFMQGFSQYPAEAYLADMGMAVDPYGGFLPANPSVNPDFFSGIGNGLYNVGQYFKSSGQGGADPARAMQGLLNFGSTTADLASGIMAGARPPRMDRMDGGGMAPPIRPRGGDTGEFAPYGGGIATGWSARNVGAAPDPYKSNFPGVYV